MGSDKKKRLIHTHTDMAAAKHVAVCKHKRHGYRCAPGHTQVEHTLTHSHTQLSFHFKYEAARCKKKSPPMLNH